MITSETEGVFTLLSAESTFVRTPNVWNQEKFFFPPPQHSTFLATKQKTTQIPDAGLVQILCESDLQDLELVSLYLSLQFPKTT